MRALAMTYAIVATLAVCGAALAQSSAQPSGSGAQTTGRANSGTGQATGVREAPIGHRQPSAKDVPQGRQPGSKIARGRSGRQETAHLPRLLDAIARPAVRSGHSQRLSAPVLKTNFPDSRPLLRLGAGELHDLGPRLGVGRDRPAVVLRRAGQRDAAKA